MQKVLVFLNLNNTYRLIFWSVVMAGITFIMMSHPMMKLRFDIWQHLGSIDDLVLNPKADIPKANWYKVWAAVFRNLGIQDIRVYAVVIHRTQFLLDCIVIYLAAAYLLPALLLKSEQDKGNLQNPKDWISSFALTSTLVWLTVIGTVSTFQQAWIMWYSVNYQLTLPFLFLAIALFINAAALPQNKNIVYAKIAGSLVLLLLIFLFHAAELFYLVIYIGAALLVVANKENFRKILIGIFLLFIFIGIGSQFYAGRMPEIVNLLNAGQGGKISNLVDEYGKYNIEGGNRYAANWNALYAVCVFCSLPILFIVFRNKAVLNFKVLFIILMSLGYCFIPTFKVSSGVVSLFYPADIINRLYFASMLFVLPSLLAYLVLHQTKKFKHPIYLVLIVFVLMGMMAAYSRYLNHGGTYFENVNSIRNSLKPDKVGIDLPAAEIESIGRQIRDAEKLYGVDGVHFCANYDKAHIVWFIYRQKNIRFYRNGITYGLDQCTDDSRAAKKHLIVID
jgi:hypothetical protein